MSAERALILAPRGRDATLAQAMLQEAGLSAEIVPTLEALVAALDEEAGFALVTEEALRAVDTAPLMAWRDRQPEWSDFPFILLTERGGLERNPAAVRHLDLLGNVTFVERPFHPTTLVSLAQSALRGRHRQYEARARMEALHRSEDRFRAAVDAVQGVLWTNTADGRMEGEQPGWAALTGQSYDEYQGYGWALAVHPDDAQPTIDAWQDALARQGLFAFEHRVRRKDNSWGVFSVRAIPTFTVGGELREWVGIHTDITARRRAEDGLRESEARYRTLFDTIDQGFCIIEFIDGPDGPKSDYVHIEANPAYERHAGLPGIVGKKVRDVVGDEADAWITLYRQILETGQPVRFERELVQTKRFLELEAFRVEPASKNQVAVLFQDVTERKRAEYALRDLTQTLEKRVQEAVAERNVLADIVETTDSFVQVMDLNFRWLAINRASADEFERIFGHRPQVGESILDVMAHLPEDRVAVEAIWARALSGEEFTQTEDFGDPTRERRSYEMKFNTLRNADGERIGAFQIVTDVTDRLRDAEQLADTQDALRQSQKMEAIGQLTGGVAHDFNNLLTVIRGGAEFLRRPDLPVDRQRRYVDAIYEAADRAAKLTHQLLAFSRRQPLRPTVFDVGERVTATADMLRSIVGGRIVMDVVCEEGLHANADLAQFETALVNLCVNARDAMDGEGLLTIHAYHASYQICIDVGDEGVGIDPEILSRLFEPFFTTKSVGKGTGLGLSQVYGFARQSGGDVTVRSTPGVGTCFTLSLPATDVAPVENIPTETARANRSKRILVVEDNDDLRSFASTLLGELGHVVDAAASADDALVTLNEAPDKFEVVFTDVVMAGMSGLELAHHIHKTWPHIQVVLASGYSDALANAEGLEFPLVSKPYSGKQLAAVL